MSDLIDPGKLKQIVEAALLAADEPLTVDRLARLFAHGELDSEEGRQQIRDTLKVLEEEAEGRGYELKRVASGFRYQVRQELSEWISRLWEEKPPRYSRALLETLALIAYKQPVTRGDIEQVRGVAVSQNIMRTLLERGWIRVVGQREVPGRPAMYGTTRAFLDYFNLKSLDQLPPLAEIRSLIEPLVIDEVVEEAVAVARQDHPEQFPDGSVTAEDGSGAEPEAETDRATASMGEVEPASGDSAADPEETPADTGASSAAAMEPARDAEQTAEVVHLTSSSSGSRPR